MKRIFVLAFLTPFFAHALNIDNLNGSRKEEFRSPSGRTEVCVIPKHWPGGGYYRNNDLESEAKLCSYDFYSNVGICPKYNSTNPAVLLLRTTDKYSKRAIDASNCNVDAMDLKTDAKFKQSISCSNTSSILAYYQLSRLLGDIGRVPVAVIRTMDLSTHADLTEKANSHLRGSREEIALTWGSYAQVHRRPASYPSLVDSSQSQIYGALSENPKNEEKYTEVSGVGSYDNRYSRFLQQKPFLRVASSKTVGEMLGTTEFTKVAQVVTQMKDVADMVLIDTLLNQQDRIGNIHYKYYWYVLAKDNPSQIMRVKSGAKLKNDKLIVPPEEKTAMTGRRGALLKEMLLKDNDCGVDKDNMMRKYSALEKVRHMSHLTYSLFMSFQRSLESSSTQQYFTRELLLSPSQYQSLKDNAAKARDILKARCRAGQLRFDLDLADYVSGAPIPQRRCDI